MIRRERSNLHVTVRVSATDVPLAQIGDDGIQDFMITALAQQDWCAAVVVGDRVGMQEGAARADDEREEHEEADVRIGFSMQCALMPDGPYTIDDVLAGIALVCTGAAMEFHCTVDHETDSHEAAYWLQEGVRSVDRMLTADKLRWS